tara:strand:+ start:1303 stop:1491 length:189 start_codon:yes stop_codon:yes gene_type:complete
MNIEDFEYECRVTITGAVAKRLIRLVDGNDIDDLHRGVIAACNLAPDYDPDLERLCDEPVAA